MQLVCVHVGAGYHARHKHGALKQLMQQACREAMKAHDGMDACVAAVRVLEDSELTNAGIGSCLTLHGAVECDASVMSGSGGEFGGVACLSHTHNPIIVAQAVWQQRRRGSLSLGRVPPMLLAGPAALDFAVAHAPLSQSHPNAPCAWPSSALKPLPPTAAADSAEVQVSCCPLVSADSRRKWLEYTSSIAAEEQRLASIEQQDAAASQAVPAGEPVPAAASPSTESGDLAANQLSTVGAIVVSLSGDVFAGVSSGGIWMKIPGRVGHAGMFGAGCSAYNATRDRFGAACSVSGTGEHIMERLLSFTVAQQLRQQQRAQEAGPSNHKRNASSARAGAASKRRRRGDDAAVPVDADADADADGESDSHDESQPDQPNSVEEVLRRALLDDQPAAYSTLPESADSAAGSRAPLPAGLIALQISPTSSSPRVIELAWAHSTPHLGVGFMSRDDPQPHAFISAAAPVDPLALLAIPPSASAPRAPSVVVAGQRFRIQAIGENASGSAASNGL